MDYLRMPDVLQQFLQASGAGPDAESNGGRSPVSSAAMSANAGAVKPHDKAQSLIELNLAGKEPEPVAPEEAEED
jgi:hypothetical protein